MALSSEEFIDLAKTGALATLAALVGRAAWQHINKGVVITTVTWRFALGGLAVALVCGYVAVGVGSFLKFPLDIKIALAGAFGYIGPKALESMAMRFLASKAPAAEPEKPKE